MLLGFVNHMRGYVKIKVTGTYLERFLNLCSRNEVSLWGIDRRDIDELHVKMNIKDFKKLKNFASKTRCKVKIIKKVGFPFLSVHFKTRYVLHIGLVIFVLLVHITTSRIWDIHLIGDANINKAEIIWALKNEKIYIGSKTSDIDVVLAKENILYNYGELAYISINIEGNIAKVELVGKEMEKMLDTPVEIPTNIISDKTGIVHKIDVISGTAIAKVGQTVMKGDLLVDALITPRVETSDYRLVEAKADITLRTWNDITLVMPVQIPKKEYTGKEKILYSLILGEKRVNLYLDCIHIYDDYDKITEELEFQLNESFIFPVRLIKDTYKQYSLTDYSIEEDNAYMILKEGTQNLITKNTDVELISSQYDFSKQGGVYILNQNYESLEKTGISVHDNRNEEQLNAQKEEKDGNT